MSPPGPPTVPLNATTRSAPSHVCRSGGQSFESYTVVPPCHRRDGGNHTPNWLVGNPE